MIVLIGTSAAGCASGGYNPGALERRLVSTGVSRRAAKCVIDAMTEKFGEDRLGGRADATADEVKAQRVLLTRCGVKTAPS